MAASSNRSNARNPLATAPEPPKPPTLTSSSVAPSYGVNGGYGGYYGMDPFSGYSALGYGPRFNPGFSGYGVGMPGVGMDPEVERFMRESQNWASKTFHPLVTVMNSMSSIGTLLQTTYYSIQSSIQAVVYVSHTFSSLGAQFNGLLVVFSLTRIFKGLVSFVQYVLGLVGLGPKMDAVWDASKADSSAGVPPVPKSSSWSIPMILAVVYGMHLVLQRIMRMARQVSIPEWARDDGDHLQGVVKEDFAGFPNEGCLPLKMGSQVRIAPSSKQSQNLVRQGWLLAAVLDAGDTSGSSLRIGLVPRSHIAQPANAQPRAAGRRRAGEDSGDLSSD